MKKAVILLSGGLDSTTCLALAKSQGYECYAMTIIYGQKHAAEVLAAKRIASDYGVIRHEIIHLDIGHLGGSALTDATIDVPEHIDSPEIPVTYVPARNTIMLSIALGWAELLHANALFIGANAVDYSHYPDCRPEYFKAFETMASYATKVSTEGHKIEIMTPLLELTKAEIVQLGLSLGVDYARTITCYQATDDGLACGTCSGCYLRKKGFHEAGIADPTRYTELACMG